MEERIQKLRDDLNRLGVDPKGENRREGDGRRKGVSSTERGRSRRSALGVARLPLFVIKGGRRVEEVVEPSRRTAYRVCRTRDGKMEKEELRYAEFDEILRHRQESKDEQK